MCRFVAALPPDRSVIRVREKRVLDDDTCPTARLQGFDEMLKEQKGRLTRLDGEVLFYLLALFPAKGRIGKDHMESVLLLNVADVFSECIGVEDVRRFDAMQDHVHDRDDVG